MIGICVVLIVLFIMDIDVIFVNFCIEDSDGNIYELSVDNCGMFLISIVVGIVG